MINLDPGTKVINLVEKVRQKFDANLSKEELAIKICDDYGVKIQKEYLNTSSDGHYSPENNSITLNKNCTYAPRTIFTLFHEILHFLIEKEGEDIIELLNEYSRSDYQDSLERLCDLGASEFLLPENKIQESVVDKDIDLSLFRELMESSTEVSAPAIARKLAHLAHYPAIFIVCGEKLFSTPSGGLLEIDEIKLQNLAIEYAFNTASFKYKLKRFHPIPENHLIHQAFSSSNDCQGEDFFPFSKNPNKMKCFVNCFVRNNRVYGILYKERPIKNENQLSFL